MTKDDKLDGTFIRLLNIMQNATKGTKLKRELSKAIAEGYPIDYRGGVPIDYRGGVYVYTDTPYNLRDTLLHKSFSFGLPEFVIQILLDYGADVNVENHDGMNALLLVVYSLSTSNIIPQYFQEVVSKTNDLDKIPRQLRVNTTALGILCRQYCTSESPTIMIAIKTLLDAGADIEAAGDWSKIYYGADKKRYYQVGEKLKGYMAMYVQQKTNFRNEQEYAGYEYEL